MQNIIIKDNDGKFIQHVLKGSSSDILCKIYINQQKKNNKQENVFNNSIRQIERSPQTEHMIISTSIPLLTL